MKVIFEKLDRYFQSNWRIAILDLKKGRWTIEHPSCAVIPYLKAENAHGRHILIQPKEALCYLLADDIPPSLLHSHHMLPNGSFKPGRMVIETSPENFQVWIHSTAPLDLEQKRIILQTLNSDPGAAPNNRFGRCPGFRNRKEKHQSANGLFPLAKLIWVDWLRQASIPIDSTARRAPQPPLSPSTPRGGGVCRLCRDHYDRGNESQTDFAYALALVRKGFSDEEIRLRILAERTHWKNHQGTKQAHYLNRTIQRARNIIENTP